MVTFTITAKDNKYRIVVDNIKELYQPLSGPGTYVNIDNGYQNYLKRLEEGKKVGKVPEFFYSYKETIETKIINSLKAYILKNDDF